MSIETVILKNGAEEASPLVVLTMMSLKSLMDRGEAMALYELVELCKDPDHTPFGVTGETLQVLSLVSKTESGWWVHNSIRNIVLSAVSGEGLDLCLVSPVAEGGA